MRNCFACGSPLSDASRFCSKCGAEVNQDAPVPVSLIADEKPRDPFRKAAVLALTIIVGLAIYSSVERRLKPPTPQWNQSEDRPSPTNDAEWLLDRCGKPDMDTMSAYDSPRAPIPTRLITYEKAHLTFAYHPGKKFSGAAPYKWELLGILDTRTKEPVPAAQLETALRQRMPCLVRQQ